MFVCLFACSFILVRLFLDIEEYLRQLTRAETTCARSLACLLTRFLLAHLLPSLEI